MKKKSVINEFNILYIVLQGLLTIAMLVFAVLSVALNKSFYKLFVLFMGLDLIVIGINNYKIYKRRNATIMYIVTGVILIGFAVLKMLEVL